MSVLASRYEPATQARFAYGPHIAFAAALAFGAAVLLKAPSWMSPDAVLPLLSVALAATAVVAAIAAIGHGAAGKTRRFSYWDAAGLLTFLAVCVAAMVEPEQMVRLMKDANAE